MSSPHSSVKGLGYTAAQAQLYTVPPYAVALVFMVGLSTFSDRKSTRGLPVASVFIIGIVGWVLLLAVSPVHATHGELHVRYFGCICVVVSLSSPLNGTSVPYFDNLRRSLDTQRSLSS